MSFRPPASLASGMLNTGSPNSGARHGQPCCRPIDQVIDKPAFCPGRRPSPRTPPVAVRRRAGAPMGLLNPVVRSRTDGPELTATAPWKGTPTPLDSPLKPHLGGAATTSGSNQQQPLAYVMHHT